VSEAGGLEATYQANKDDLMIMNVIIEDESGNAPDAADLESWSSQFGLTLPVLADAGSSTLYSYATGGSIGLPFTVLLDRGVVVESTNYPSSGDAINLAGAR
jgi:hypothetical protein